jgi:hypothetical protein
LLLAGPLLAAAVAASLAQAFRAARAATRDLRLGAFERPRRLVLITALHLLQPAARLRGRLDSGLTPWRQSGEAGASFVLPRQVRARFWSERWQPPEAWIRSLRTGLAETGGAVVDGGAFDGWDLEARGGALGAVRLLIAVEEHGGGRQLIRVRGWPRPSRWALVLTAPAMLLAAAGAMSGAWSAATVFGLVALALVLRTIRQAGAATQAVRRGLDQRAGSLAVSVPAAGQQG